MKNHGPNYVEINGKLLTLRQLADLYRVPYGRVLYRWRCGLHDPWELIGGPGGKPVPIPLTAEEKSWLHETERARRGMVANSTKIGLNVGEWDIACDLIGIPRRFARELREALDG